ncbi:thioredoxin [Aquabacterium humicola]|uniref:thioredoxin n=1 Tax=Aquabacterium humicola TaxID=3237377 RepID=UPI0025437C5C|nr:thioredoxin [Rubrivivax pictus]
MSEAATSTNTAALDAASFAAFIANEPGAVVVDFWAPWCGPCRALAPRLEQLARQFEGQIRVRKLNVDDAPELAAAHGVRGIPTLILFKDGQAHSRLVGLHDETQLSSWVRAAL